MLDGVHVDLERFACEWPSSCVVGRVVFLRKINWFIFSTTDYPTDTEIELGCHLEDLIPPPGVHKSSWFNGPGSTMYVRGSPARVRRPVLFKIDAREQSISNCQSLAAAAAGKSEDYSIVGRIAEEESVPRTWCAIYRSIVPLSNVIWIIQTFRTFLVLPCGARTSARVVGKIIPSIRFINFTIACMCVPLRPHATKPPTHTYPLLKLKKESWFNGGLPPPMSNGKQLGLMLERTAAAAARVVCLWI